MTRKSAYYALAVVVAVVLAAGMLLGTSGVALASGEGSGFGRYGTEHSSYSSEPAKAVAQPYAEEIRGPMETGALPDQSVKLDRPDRTGWVNMNVADQEASPDLRDAHNVQSP